MNSETSAIGPKRTSLVAPHMSAFRGKADIDESYFGPSSLCWTRVTRYKVSHANGKTIAQNSALRPENRIISVEGDY